jgi:TPR repeat protein
LVKVFVIVVVAAVSTTYAQQHVPLPSVAERSGAMRDSTGGIEQLLSLWWGIQSAPDRERACVLARQLAERDERAAFIWAECLADWRSLPPNPKHADSIWAAIAGALSRRAAAGDADAQVLWAEYYRRGLGGVVPNEDSATALLERAAACGHGWAAFVRAQTTRDKTARQLLERASQAHVVAAQVALARQLLADTATAAEAVELLRAAADSGSHEGALLLGQCYAAGIGMPPNQTRALQYLVRAADQGNVTAMLELSYRMLRGIGMPADTTGAMVWMLDALARSARTERDVIIAYWRAVSDSVPTLGQHLGRACNQIAQQYAPTRYSADACAYLLTGDGVRVWKAWWRPSVSAPLHLVLRDDGTAMYSDGQQLTKTTWSLVAPTEFACELGTAEQRVQIVAIADGLCALQWNGTLTLYVPMSAEELHRIDLFRYSALLRPQIELLPPRVGERHVQVRVRAGWIPRMGVALTVLGLGRECSTHVAELGIRASVLWRLWNRGDVQLRWEPSPEDIPHAFGKTAVLFLQCVWQYEGSEQSMVIKSRPFALPSRLQRR